MSLYNRITKQLQPITWEAEHDHTTFPGKNRDWYKWHMATHPLIDMIVLYINGEFGSGAAAKAAMKATFDMSDAEVDQLLELFASFISDPDPTEEALNAATFRAYLGSMERGIPQEFDLLNTEAKFNTKFGITTPDDR